MLESAGRPSAADDKAAICAVGLIIGSLGTIVLYHGLELAHGRTRLVDCDAAASTADGSDDLAVLGQQPTRVTIGSKDHLLGLDFASGSSNGPVSVGVG